MGLLDFITPSLSLVTLLGCEGFIWWVGRYWKEAGEKRTGNLSKWRGRGRGKGADDDTVHFSFAYIFLFLMNHDMDNVS